MKAETRNPELNAREEVSSKRIVLILEDNEERIRNFMIAVGTLDNGLELKVWSDAPSMISESPAYFERTTLISLDHDLNPKPEARQDPGTGLDVALILAKRSPLCPVILHTTNYERRWSMHNEFRFGGWTVEIVAPFDDDWIQKSWLPTARRLLALGVYPGSSC